MIRIDRMAEHRRLCMESRRSNTPMEYDAIPAELHRRRPCTLHPEPLAAELARMRRETVFFDTPTEPEGSQP